MTKNYIISEKCIGCGICKKRCPWSAIFGEKKECHVIEPTICQGCGTCWHSCPKSLVEDTNGVVRKKAQKAKVPTAQIDNEACVGCQNCSFNCEQEAIDYKSGLINGHCIVDAAKCIGCGNCMSYCAGNCIRLGHEE